MSNAMHVAKTGLNAQNSRMQVIANNLANVNTTGFKRDRANFETLLYQVIKESGAQTSGETKSNSAFSVGTGVRIINADKLFSQGNIVASDNALDVSIDGSIPATDNRTLLLTGFLVCSNVKSVDELVAGIDQARAYAINVKFVTTAKEIDEATASLMRMPS